MGHIQSKSLRICAILTLGVALTLAIGLTVMAQDPAPHPKEDAAYENCTSCHLTGANDAPLAPNDHADFEDTECSLCHDTAGAPFTEVEPPDIPHPIIEWEDCLGCHQRWEGKGVDIPNIADSILDHTTFAVEDCETCHEVASETREGIPEIACGTCHPKNATAETAHNNPETWVECADCHQTASSYPHDPELILAQNENCLSCHYEQKDSEATDAPDKKYSLSDHVAWSAAHVGVDCSACHLQYAIVERNPTTGRIRPVLPEVVGIPPDTPEWANIDREVDCQRCHFSGNTVAAPATELPPRGALCIVCHDASPVVRDGLSWAGIGIFGLGMVLTASIWLQGSVGGRQGLSLPARLWRTLVACFRLFFSPRLFTFLRTFIVDGIFHKNLFHRSKPRWLAHALMFFGTLARMALCIFTWLMTLWAPTLPLTQALINQNSPAVALIYDALGFAVILGAVMAMVRRYIVKDKQLVSGQQDAIAISLIGAIFLVGFIVEGTRILTTDPQPVPAIYSFIGYPISSALGLTPVDWEVVYGSLWYVHAGLVAALVAYLPLGKFLHVVVSPIVTALNSALKEE